MSKKIIECVPNISEGRDEDKIRIISQIVEEVDGVKLLNVDPGKATNRTVITFVGEPQQVIDAAFLLIQKAQELIDMSKHSGEHPRMGATDVCPLVPISNISMDEVVIVHMLNSFKHLMSNPQASFISKSSITELEESREARS